MMQTNIQSKNPENLALNKGIEIMLPRRRGKIEKPWLDRTFRLLKANVRVRIDINRGTNGN
jgi:hypothetical protein